MAGVGDAVVHQGGVDEHAVGGAVDVGEQPVVAVTGLDVARQADLGARRDERGQGRGRLGAEALDRAPGRDRLGRVDADQADGLGAAGGQGDDEGVAVDGAHDRGRAGRAVRAAVRGGPDQEREDGGGHRAGGGAEGAQSRGHPSLRKLGGDGRRMAARRARRRAWLRCVR